MTNAETIWNVISWYYGNSTPIGLLLIVMTVYLLAKKKEYRYYTVGGLFFSFLILNQLTYRVITKLGEGSTYYRFLWMFPVSLLAAWFLLKILERVESGWIKAVCVIMAGCLVFLYSGMGTSEWFRLPENIYQMPEDQIQIADLIDEVTDGERVNVYAEDSLLYGIREYNANICLVTEGERGYLYHIITEDDPNASGNLMLGILVNAKIDYIAVRKEYSGAKVALNSGGCVKVGQTDNYALYYVDQERSQADLYHTYNSDWNTATVIAGVEDVMIQGTEGEQQFLLYGNGRLEAFNNETGEQQILFAGTDTFYSKEYEGYIVCEIDNRNQGITEQLMQKIKTEEEKSKPIILVLKRPLTWGEKSDRLLEWIETGESQIQGVYALNADENKKEMLTGQCFQCHIANGSDGNALLVQVFGE